MLPRRTSALRGHLLLSTFAIALIASPVAAQETDEAVFQMLGRIIFGAGTAKVAIDTPQAVTVKVQADLDPATQMIRVAHEEFTALVDFPVDAAYAHAVQQRTRLAMDRIEASALARLRAGSGLLASIGATSPFIGLFGTVFGIMNAFLAIAETKTTSLAVVAPGIAEALFATAIGLLAAIPAVLIYNGLSRAITAYRRKLADASAQIERLLSRDLDRRSATHFKTVG